MRQSQLRQSRQADASSSDANLLTAISYTRAALLLACLASVLMGSRLALAQEDAKNKPAPVGRIVPVPSPVADETVGLIRRTSLELQDLATREGREAVLFLKIEPGVSSFYKCLEVADILTVNPLRNVTTVAWIPEDLTGNHVLIALACNEIVLGPEVTLGDMGNGEALPEDQQVVVRNVVARRRNSMVTEPLANALMNPAASLMQLTVEAESGGSQTQLLTAEEARKLRDSGAVITESQTLSEAGTPTTISAQQARSLKILATHTAQSSKELIAAYGVSIDSLREVAPAQSVENVAYIELHDMIDEVFATFAQRQIQRAVTSGAKTIIFEIDSPGGLLLVTQDLAMTIAGLRDRDIHTVAYIPREAYSGAAILAVACDDIYLAPAATIGDAIPINMMGDMILKAEGKVLSVETKLLRDLAEMKNRPAALLEAFADENLEVFRVRNKESGQVWYMSNDEYQKVSAEWELGPRVPESRPGIALTVDGKRAHELMLAKAPVKDQAELKQRLGIPLDHVFKAIGRTWVDSTIFWLNNRFITGMLFFVAIVCIYLEMATMTGFFGIMSATAFGIFFWSRMLGGTATGLEVVLFLIGLGMLALEILVIPGFGVFGVSGILLVLASLIMASQTFTGFNLTYDLAEAGRTVVSIGTAFLAVIFTAAFLSNNLHRIPILRQMVLSPPGTVHHSADEPRLRPELTPEQAALMGNIGKTLSALRPAGKVRMNGTIVDVFSEGPYVPEGVDVTVVRVTRNRIFVRPSDEA